jgi:hypothetical protein
MPAALGILALFLFLSGNLTFNNQSVAPVEEISRDVPSQPAATVSSGATEEAIGQPLTAANDVAGVRTPAIIRTTLKPGKKTLTPKGGGSVDRTLGVANNVINPREFSPTAGISIRDALSVFGIDAEQAAEGWSVKKVSANSAAERSGIQAADMIQMVGNQAVGGKSSFANRVYADTVTLLRQGKRIVIKLANR